jgi:hypothetical protein
MVIIQYSSKNTWIILVIKQYIYIKINLSDSNQIIVEYTPAYTIGA